MEQSPDRYFRVQNALAAVIVVLFAVFAWQTREPIDLEGADEAEYLALSRSMEQGAYREVFEAGAPRGAKYPPVYPALQLVISAIAGDDTDPIRLVNILMVAAALTLTFLCVRMLAGGWMAIGWLAAAAINPLTVKFAGSLMSEATFIFLASAALYAAFMAEQSRHRWPALVIATVSLAFLTRTAGVALVAAIAIWFWTRRSRREFVTFAAITTLVVGGWFAYVGMVSGEGAKSYGRDLAVANVAATAPAAAGVLERAVRSTKALATGAAVSAMGLPTIEGTPIDNALWLAALVILVPIGVISLWRAWRAMALYLMCYAALLVVWPYPSDRLLSVIAPELKLAMLLAAHQFARRVNPRAALPAVAALVVLFGAGAYKANRTRYTENARCDRTQPLAANACHNPVEHALIDASSWLAQHSRPNDIIVTSKGPSIFYLSGRATVSSRRVRRLYDGLIVDTLRANGIRYVFMGQLIPSEDGRLADLLSPRCNEVRVEWSGLPAGLLVSILPPGETSDGACDAIESFRRTINERAPDSAG